MKAAVVIYTLGVFAFDEEGEMVEFNFFPKDIDKAVEIIRRVNDAIIREEIIMLIERLREKGYTQFIFENDAIARNVRETLDVKVIVERQSLAGERFRSNMREIILKTASFSNLEELYDQIHDVLMELGKAEVRESSAKRDLIISQAILALDDLDKVLNLFANRLREWYSLHFPELGSLIERNDLYLRLISSLGDRSNFTLENLEKTGMTSEKVKDTLIATKESMGASISEKDTAEIRNLSKAILEMYNSRERLEEYLDEIMMEVAPNICELAGATLGARLIAVSGGLKNLASRSASTIQVLGAEKALFRSLRTGTKPPKHGLIFQHNEVHTSPRWQRGKIARLLASKLAIAARLDAYGAEYKAGRLKMEFDERLNEIKEKYAEAPKKRNSH